MNRLGKWYIVPLGGYLGGQIKWKPQVWGVEAEITQYKDSPDGIRPPEDETTYVRLPWKTLGQMLVTRDE